MAFSKEVNVPVDTLKKRWICDRFYRVRKCEALVASGNGQTHPDKMSFYKYEILKFLADVQMMNKSTTGNFDEAEERSLECEITFDVEEACCSTFCTSETISSTTAKSSRKRKRDDVETEMLHHLKTIKTTSAQSVTPFRTFLEGAICSLRQINRLQMRIMQLVPDGLDIVEN